MSLQILTDHILAQLDVHRRQTHSSPAKHPLFVAIQGPQGCGKTYLTSLLRPVLESPPHALSVTILSIDDLYLPYSGLVALSEAHPKNKLLNGRGHPGTHDLELGSQLLHDLKHINELTDNGVPREVAFPRFDKSLHGGLGDRVQGSVERAPVDVVIMEGWCVGFCPVTMEDLDKRWSELEGGSDGALYTSVYQKDDVVEINEMLKDYVDWWHYFHVCIQIRPVLSSPFSLIFKWRLQQEHDMKARNGGIGMSDAQVHSFVDRYIPGYIFFGDGVRLGTKHADGTCQPPSWIGNGLLVTIGEEREVVDVTRF